MRYSVFWEIHFWHIPGIDELGNWKSGKYVIKIIGVFRRSGIMGIMGVIGIMGIMGIMGVMGVIGIIDIIGRI